MVLLLTSQESVVPLIRQSPLSVDDKLIFLVEWYDGFENRCRIPRFPVKLFFPGLPPEFRVPEVLS